MLADQADGSFRIVEGDGHDIGQHIFRRALGVGDRNRSIAAPRLRRGIKAHFGVVVGAMIGALAFGDFRTAGKRARRLQRHHDSLGARICETHLLHRGQPRRQQFRKINLGLGRQAERRSQRKLLRGRFHQRRMRVAVDQRGKIIDAVDIFVAVDIPDPAPLTARGIDRIRLHEYGGAGVAAGQARQSTIVELLRTRLRIWIHACFTCVAQRGENFSARVVRVGGLGYFLLSYRVTRKTSGNWAMSGRPG